MVLFSTTIAQEIKLTPENTSIKFEITHLGVLTVVGTFDEFSGSIAYTDSGYFIKGIIIAQSINTENTERDETLRSDAYFDVGAYREIQFEGNGVQVEDTINVIGTIFLKDLSTELVFDLISKEGFLVAHQIVLSRKKLGFTFGSTEFLIGDEVLISIEIEGSF
jgi:polyisoprenoid-binding protein YceI